MLDAEQRRSGELERELAERVVQVKSVEDHAAGLETMLGAEQRRSGELEARLENLMGEFTTVRESAEQLEALRRQENAFFSARVADLERQKDELEQERHRSGAERDTVLAERDAALAERDTVLAERDTALAAALAERDAARAERDSVLAELAAAQEVQTRTQRKAAGLILECDALREALFEQQGRAGEEQAAETAALADAHREIARLELERLNYDELAQHTHEAETLLADIMGSHSWRLTLPARRFMGAFRNRGKR